MWLSRFSASALQPLPAGHPEEPSGSDRAGRAGRQAQDQHGLGSLVARGAKYLLSDITHFASLVTQQPLREYQIAPLRPIIQSILNQDGYEFLLVFPRQSGKNEAIAQLLTYLLNLFCRVGGNIIYGAVSDTLGLGIDRLEKRLDNNWNLGQWTSRGKPAQRCLLNACVAFLSTHPQATARGHTAHWLLVVDEAQDQVGPHLEAVFTPMRAAYNATAVYIGTVKLTTDFLWTKKRELEAEQHADGIQRVFMVTPEQVVAENHAYQRFLERQVQKHGRHHPTIASEYFLEPVDGSGGLFDARRVSLMRGSHPRLHTPSLPPSFAGDLRRGGSSSALPHAGGGGGKGSLYVATLDVAGEDEAATDPLAQLANPGRDYTVATIFEVEFQPPGVYAAGPTYRAVDVFVDHGSKHFSRDTLTPGGEGKGEGDVALIHRLHGFFQHWDVAHLVADQSGVGQGLVSWLQAAMGEHRVTGYGFSGRTQKAALGSAFVALVETGRFKYWTGDEDQPGSDGWWYWQQVAACTYELPPDGQYDRDLRWFVPANHRTDTPTGRELTHDDRLVSAALIAELDRLYRTGHLTLGTGASEMIAPRDPFGSAIY